MHHAQLGRRGRKQESSYREETANENAGPKSIRESGRSISGRERESPDSDTAGICINQPSMV